MKQRLGVLIRAVLIFLSISGAMAQAAAPDFIKTKFLAGDVQTYPVAVLERAITRLQQSGFNTITLPVAWSVVEPEPGNFDVSPYYDALDRIAASGLKMIIHLDASAREVLVYDGERLYSTGTTAVPLWLIQRYPEATAMDFSGERAYNLDYADKEHLPELEKFYRTTLQALKARYGDQILAFVPGLVHELEIKYAQWGYRWQSYTPAAQQGFADWLQQAGKAPAALPVIDYSNHIDNTQARVEPLFEDYMRYREHSLRDYVCRLTGWIREAGYPAGGYFGQSLTSHDGIYALGIIEEVVDCFDKVTVDYNYFDGWRAEMKPNVLPVLVNYARNLGYQQVLAGLYLEKYYAPDGRFIDAYLDTARATLDRLRLEAPSGIEFGNVLHPDLERLEQLPISGFKPVAQAPAPYRIGLVASKWTYYLWHGEQSYQRNIIEDALLASYRLLSEQADFEVAVLGEKALLEQDLSQYDALVLSLQTTVSEAAAAAIRDYYQQGGKLVQDAQYRAFNTDGSNREGWESELFGIGGLSWHRNPEKFVVAGKRLNFPKQRKLHLTYTLLAAQPGYQVLMRRFNNLNEGLMLRGPRSLVFGFLPQLAVDPGKGDFWQRLFVDAIREVLASTPE